MRIELDQQSKSLARLCGAASLALFACACSGDSGPSGAAGASGARAFRLVDDAGVPTGPAATGRAGDYVLENEVVRFVVQDVTPSPWVIGTLGGHLVDAELRDTAGEEMLKIAVPMVAFDIQVPTAISLPASDEPGVAMVRVEGSVQPFGYLPSFVPVGRNVEADVVTDYVLRPGSSVLEVTTRVTNTGRSLGDNAWLMDLVQIGGDSRDFVGVGGDDPPDFATGVDFFASRTPRAALAVTTAAQPISATGTISGLRPIVYATAPLFANGTASYTRYWIPGRDLAAVLAQVYRLRGVATGTITGSVRRASDAPGAAERISIRDGGGGPLVSEAYAAADGSFAAELPAGRYRLEASEENARASAPVEVDVVAGQAAPVMLEPPARGTVTLRVRDLEARPLPAEVLISGPSRDRVLTASGELVLRLDPGTYHLIVMRGPEYDLVELDLDVLPDEQHAPVEVTLRRAVDTSGWVAADFHLHSARSSDSTMLLEERVTSLAASGLEWVVSSDHDQVTDYAPVLESLALSAWLKSTSGDEISTSAYGHFNLFPLRLDPARAGRGAVDWFFRDPATLFRDALAAAPDGVLQLNHPRLDRFGGYLEAIGYDPGTGRATRSPSEVGFPSAKELPIDRFHAMEVFNDIDIEKAELAFSDWVSFVNLGLEVTMTGNSDSHSQGRIAGFPRNYVRASSDAPGSLDVPALVRAVRDSQLTVSGGLFLTANLADGSGIGDLARHAPGNVSVMLALRAAPWVDADGVEVLVDGRVAASLPVAETGDPLRLSAVVEVPVERDSWLVARAWGDRPLVPWQDRMPFAATNPIWIDVDGNGRFDAPGLAATR